MTRVAIGAGGTAGHVVPALVAGRALVDHGLRPDEVVFFGARGLECTLVPKAGFPLVSLPVRGVRRPFWHPGNVLGGLRMAGATAAAGWWIVRRGIRAVLSIGGYAAIPAALAAAVTRRRLVLFEPNAVPGLANRACAPFAHAVAVPFPGFGEPFGRRVEAIGPLLRPEIWTPADPMAARMALGVPPARMVVGLLGGSQGARRLNEALIDCYDAWRHRDDLAVVHLAGRRDLDEVRSRLEALRSRDDGVVWVLLGFLDDMVSFYAACDVVVSRAGANTLAELLATGTPSVMVPGAFAEGHQAHNAEVAASAGAAVVIPDAAASGPRLRREIESLLADPRRRAAMSDAARALAGEPRAAGERLARLLLDGVQ